MTSGPPAGGSDAFINAGINALPERAAAPTAAARRRKVLLVVGMEIPF
jgi:hypothetical protein